VLRPRAEYRNHIWSYDFVADRTHDGRKFRRRRVHRRVPGDPGLTQAEVDRCDRRPVGPLILRGVPGHIRSDNGPEFVAKAVQDWITTVGAKTASIAPAVLGRTATLRASMRACVTNSSTVRSSTRCVRRISSSRAGGVLTMGFAGMPRLLIEPPAPELYSCRASPDNRRRQPRPAPPDSAPLARGRP